MAPFSPSLCRMRDRLDLEGSTNHTIRNTFRLMKSPSGHLSIFIGAAPTPAAERECLHMAIFWGSLLGFLVPCLPPAANLGVASSLSLDGTWMDMFSELLLCAVNPSVCLQWGGGGREGREGGRREGHLVPFVAGREASRGV